MYFWKNFSQKYNFEKSQQTTKKACKITQIDCFVNVGCLLSDDLYKCLQVLEKKEGENVEVEEEKEKEGEKDEDEETIIDEEELYDEEDLEEVQ